MIFLNLVFLMKRVQLHTTGFEGGVGVNEFVNSVGSRFINRTENWNKQEHSFCTLRKFIIYFAVSEAIVSLNWSFESEEFKSEVISLLPRRAYLFASSC